MIARIMRKLKKLKKEIARRHRRGKEEVPPADTGQPDEARKEKDA